MTKTIERRFPICARSKPRVTTRADDDEAKVIVGYGAVFYDPNDEGTQYRLWDRTFERIMPGCFDAAIIEDDVRGMREHKELLGRTKSKTVRLSVDQVGLRYEIDVPDTQAGRDTVTLLERGDLDGSSFAFDLYGRRGRVQWIEETIDGVSIEAREIYDCELYDVGPVTFPAYPSTTSGVRSADAAELRDEHAAWRRSLEAGGDDLLDVDIDISEAELRLRE